MASQCRHCRAPIVFAETAGRKWVALDASARQVVMLVDGLATPTVAYDLHRCAESRRRQLEIFSDEPGGDVVT